MKKLFNEVGNYLVKHNGWQKKSSIMFIKRINKYVYAYIHLYLGEYIGIGYSNPSSAFEIFTTDDDDFQMEVSAELIYDIAILTEKIAEKYSKMINFK